MSSKERITDELKRDLEDLQTIRDEVRVKMHLATLDAKEYWKQLEPRVAEIEHRIVHDTGEQARDAITGLMVDVSGALKKLRDRLDA